MKSISRPVIDRLPVGQLDDFACRQLDRVSPRQCLRRVFVGARGVIWRTARASRSARGQGCFPFTADTLGGRRLYSCT